VNDTTEKTAPKGAVHRIGESLLCMIHAFSEAEEDANFFMEKWDIKDGFWRMDCENREEWNFMYVLPLEEGKPIELVAPTLLQMGWVEYPPYWMWPLSTLRIQ
jgi:hypothetical protein